MDKYNVYQDMSRRTGGEIYLGVVGPVRRRIGVRSIMQGANAENHSGFRHFRFSVRKIIRRFRRKRGILPLRSVFVETAQCG